MMRNRVGMASGRRARRGAFSLVEMVMVLTIISLVAAIAVPRFSGAIARRRLDSAATRVLQDISIARQHARLISGDVKITFAKNKATYLMDKVPDPNAPGTMYSADLRDAPYHVTGWAAAFDVNEEVTFNMYGIPDKSGRILLSVGGEAKAVLIDGDTGKAKVTNDASVIIAIKTEVLAK